MQKTKKTKTKQAEPTADIKVDQKPKELANFQQLGDLQKQVSDKQLEFIKDTIAPNLNRKQLFLFLYQANRLNLDPLNGEIFGYSSKGRLVTIVSRDGKRVVAERTGKLESISVNPIYVVEGSRVKPWESGAKLWGAEAIVRRKDRNSAFEVTVRLSEYDQGNTIWKQKPETMIKKVAESQALSMAFPELLSGVYDEAEKWFDDGGERSPQKLKVKGGDKPASEEQIATIEGLGGKVEDGITKQEAAEKIQELSEGEKNA